MCEAVKMTSGKRKKPTATYIIGTPFSLCNENQHQDGI